MSQNSKNLPTLKDILKAHGWKRDYDRYLLLARFVFRPVGFLVTWAAIRIGLTTEAVSWISGAVGIAGCIWLASGHESLLPVGIGLLLFFNLLDCVDGSIARAMKTENPYGRFLDSICGGIIDLAFWGIIGIMAFRHPQQLYFPNPFGLGNLFWLMIGCLTCFFYIWLEYLERTFDELLRPYWDRLQEGQAKELRNLGGIRKTEPFLNWFSMKDYKSIIRAINNNLRVRESHYFLLVIAYWLRIVDVFLLIYLLYYLGHIVFLMGIYTKRGRLLKRGALSAPRNIESDS
jgi:phosphatidylglycerophosphate synthase